MTPQIEIIHRIDQVSAEIWNSLNLAKNPFMQHEFLAALEQTDAVCAKTGWQPHHLLLKQDDKIIAAMPLYLKSHSWGEYVFDWSWADAWDRAGLDYYPKLVTSAPFTPSTGPRILFDATQINLEDCLTVFLATVQQLCAQNGLSGWHGLFIPTTQTEQFKTMGCHLRQGKQYHWFNRDYQSFEHYLESFNSRKRKMVRKERSKIANSPIEMIRIEGDRITTEQLQIFYRFYQLTYLRHGHQGYLDEAFFTLLVKTMPESLLLVLAQYEGKPVAGALSLKDADTLYGRYWGCDVQYDTLHFETCYYQGIDYCIEKGLKHFDPGAQGEHKIARGFEPITTWSAHWISEPTFRAAIGQFCLQEQALINEEMLELQKMLPFRNSESS